MNATVDFGLTTGYGSSAVTESYQATTDGRTVGTVELPLIAETYVHNVRLTDLLPNTVYNYRVTQGASVSANYTFRTAPLAGTAATFGFAADSRSDTSNHNMVAGQVALKNPNMMIYGGDLVNEETYNSWKTEWHDVPNQAALDATTPFVNAPGNHEGWATNTRAFTESPSGTDGESGNGYFSYDYGDVHILVLNNYVDDSRDSAQWNFAKNDLETSDAKFKIVAFHTPAISYGYHGFDGDMLAMTNDIFEPNGVDFVMAGHNHYYQHNLKNGIHHMVIGSMGAPLTDPGLTGTYLVKSEKVESFAIFDTDGGDTLTMSTYRGLDGSLIETVVVTVPEPATMSLLAIGGLAMIRRRKRRA